MDTKTQGAVGSTSFPLHRHHFPTSEMNSPLHVTGLPGSQERVFFLAMNVSTQNYKFLGQKKIIRVYSGDKYVW